MKGEADWPVTWEANRRAQLRSALEVTAEARLAWLEDALRLAAGTGALARRRSERSGESPAVGRAAKRPDRSR